mmetsp:Transcript_14435/g.54473  ORF Transcript_14435/g.54473 Transcript_14435/m.54473 type:complete len:155 (-) Transcript_14435:24-488(-)
MDIAQASGATLHPQSIKIKVPLRSPRNGSSDFGAVKVVDVAAYNGNNFAAETHMNEAKASAAPNTITLSNKRSVQPQIYSAGSLPVPDPKRPRLDGLPTGALYCTGLPFVMRTPQSGTSLKINLNRGRNQVKTLAPNPGTGNPTLKLKPKPSGV